MSELNVGMTNTINKIAEENMLACNVGSGTLKVLATPAVLALMEQAACELVQPYLPEGITTVGTSVSLQHISATPCGSGIRAEAVLTDIADRKYTFEITAYDCAGVIAKAKHERLAVKSARFMEKTDSKLG